MASLGVRDLFIDYSGVGGQLRAYLSDLRPIKGLYIQEAGGPFRAYSEVGNTLKVYPGVQRPT